MSESKGGDFVDAKKVLTQIGLAVYNSFESKMSHMAYDRNLPTEARARYLENAMTIHGTKENFRRYVSGPSMSENMDEDEGVDEVMRDYEARYEKLLRDSSNRSDGIG